MFSRKTKIELTSSTSAALERLKQVIEVYFDRPAEFDRMNLAVAKRQFSELDVREVELNGVVTLYEPAEYFHLTSEMTLWKRSNPPERSSDSWEAVTLTGHLSSADGKRYCLTARWRHSVGAPPEVRVIRSPNGAEPIQSEHRIWRVGRDRTNVREEPLRL